MEEKIETSRMWFYASIDGPKDHEGKESKITVESLREEAGKAMNEKEE